ncbi:MAG: sulfite exporter TauE/SafE family protein [Mariprofundaceae bacterium]
MNSSYLLLFSMGLFGGLHCIGMCGGLVGALAMSRPRVWWNGLLVYQLGRIVTYALLGFLVGGIGLTLVQLGGSMIQQILAIFAGLVMVGFGLNLAGLLPDMLSRATAAISSRLGLSRLAYQLSRNEKLRGWFVMGMANGLLPCGLVYAALSLAMGSGTMTRSVLLMFAFGMGTVPAMLLAPAALRKLAPGLRGLLLRIAGVLLTLMGLLTMMRGFGMHHMIHV